MTQALLFGHARTWYREGEEFIVAESHYGTVEEKQLCYIKSEFSFIQTLTT